MQEQDTYGFACPKDNLLSTHYSLLSLHGGPFVIFVCHPNLISYSLNWQIAFFRIQDQEEQPKYFSQRILS